MNLTSKRSKVVKVINLLLIISFIILPITPVFAEELSPRDTTSNLSETTDPSIESVTETETVNETKIKPARVEIAPKDESLNEPTEEPLPEEDLALLAVNGISKIEEQKVLLGEVDERSGAFSYSYPFALPPFRNMNPELSLNYNSQNESKNYISGYGFELSNPYIKRLNREGTNDMYGKNYFYSSISNELVPINPNDIWGEYGSKKENGTYLKYERIDDSNFGDYWKMTTKDGVVYTFGSNDSSKQNDPNNEDNIYTWYLTSINDLNGNTITYTYTKQDNQIFPTQINYGPFEITLEYQDLNQEDQISQYNSNFEIKTTKELSSVKIYHSGILDKTYSIIYTTPIHNQLRLIDKIIDNSIPTSPQITDFDYGQDQYNFERDTNWDMPYNTNTGVGLVLDSKSNFIDINNDGLPDFVYTSTSPTTFVNDGDTEMCNDYTDTVFINTGTDFERDPDWKMPCYYSSGNYYKVALDDKTVIVDLNKDGLPDIMATNTSTFSGGTIKNDTFKTVYINTGTGFVRNPNWNMPYNTNTNQGLPLGTSTTYGSTLADINNDGLPDFIYTSNANSGKFFPDGNEDCNDYVGTVFINHGDDVGFYRDVNWKMPCDSSSGSQHYRLMLGTSSVFTDLNNDGLTDFFYSSAGSFSNTITHNDPTKTVFINNQTGFIRDVDWSMPYYISGSIHNPLILDNSKSTFADLNNDGLPDFIYTDNGVFTNNNYNDPTRTVFINTGTTFTRNPTWSMPYNDASSIASGVIFGNFTSFTDINNDGLPDFIYNNAGPFSTGNNPPYNDSLRTVFINDGTDFVRDSNWSMPYYLNGSTYTSLPTVAGQGTFIDLNSDGLTDFVGTSTTANSTTDTVFLNSGPKDVLINSITTTYGGSIAISYAEKEMDNMFPPGSRLPATVNVVESVTYDDLYTPQATTTYTYEGGKYYYDMDTYQPDCFFYKKYAGFAMSTKTDPIGNVTKTYYHQGDIISNEALGEYEDNKFKITRPYRTEQYDNEGHLFRTTITKWYTFSLVNGYKFVSQYMNTVLDYDGNGTHLDRAIIYGYDDYGNLIYITNFGKVLADNTGYFVDLGTDDYAEYYSYATKEPEFITSNISGSYILDHSFNKVKETKIYYDNLPFGQVTFGLPTKQENFVKAGKLGNPDIYVTTQSAYNTVGLPILTIDANNNTTFYTYDSYNLYPVSIKNALNQFTYYTYDYSSGKVIESIDENNLVYQTVYDALDRPIEEKSPSQTAPYTPITKTTYTHDDTPGATSVKTTKYLDATNLVDTYQYLDGFGRLIQERSEAEGVDNYNVKDTVYDSRGLVAKQSLPYLSTGYAKTPKTTDNSLYITNTYDPLGRVKTMTDATGTTTYAYDEWVTTTTDKNGKIKRYYKDAYDNLVKVDEVNGPQTYSTNYTWDLAGNLVKITDALGNIRNFIYDGLGRRLFAEDLHGATDTTFGGWNYIYDNNGNLTKAVSPRSNAINYTYDAINQLKTEDATSTSGIDITYNYGGCSFGINKVCSVTTNSAVNTSYAYDSNSNIINELKTINGIPYNTHYYHDYLGNIIDITYPDDSLVHYSYNNAGLVEKIESAESGSPLSLIVSNYDYNPLGQVSTMTYGNGVTTTNTYNPSSLYRLTRRLTQNPSLSKLQDLNYTYDNAGNITNLTDSSNTATAKSLTYTYDDLYRLTNVSGSYNRSFSYNPIGNLTSGPGGSYLYTSGQGNYYNPHAATVVGGTNQYYDNEGNLTSYSNITNTWSYNNRLTKQVRGTNYYSKITINYLYDYAGERAYQNISSYYDGQKVTYYPNDYYNTYIDSEEYLNTKTTKQIFGNGETVATIEITKEYDEDDNIIDVYTTYFNHNDILGSISAISDISGNLVNAQDYYPYGGSRVSSGSYNSQRKYIGEIYDSITDLNYLNARYYNGSKGQFISIDPQFWNPEKYLMDPQSLNSYSYARNNPVMNKDGSGEYFESLIDVGFIVYDVFDLAIAYASGDDYSEQLGYLSLDVTGLALPFATGLGLAGRGAARAAKVAKTGAKVIEGTTTLAKVESKYVTKIAGAEIKYFGKTYKGTVDLAPTLTRIEEGKKLSQFPRDGVVFNNVNTKTGKNLLPIQKQDYYKEYVVPTATETGPGRQRIIVGQNGERYYTPDHYQSFIDLSIK